MNKVRLLELAGVQLNENEPTDRSVLEDVYNTLHEIAGPDNDADYVEVEAALERVLKVVKNQLLLKGTAP